MIRLHRPPTVPPYFASTEIESFRAAVRAHFSRSAQVRRQERPDFPLFPREMFARLIDDLLALSHGKCAYCELPVADTHSVSLDRFRPKAGAVGLEGDFSTEHYWWLAYRWENIYPSCLKCNKFKGAKFPVEGRRSRPGARPAELAAERRLLVDPCADDPDKHLYFRDDGLVSPLTSAGDVTIATLELNRSDLVSARKRVAQRLLKQLKATLDPDRVAEEGRPSQPYAAVARAVIRRWTEGAAGPRVPSGAARRRPRGTPPPGLESAASGAFGATAKQRRVSKRAQALRSRIVTRVGIHNFRGVRDLELTMEIERGQGAPWTVLLGENATGKSSILQAVALTLLENDQGAHTATTPRHVLTHGQTEGWVKVWMDEATEPRVLSFGKGRRRFRREGPEFPGVLLGYGATRLLPRGQSTAPKGRVRLENMFDPFRPLLDANLWLGQLDPKSFDFVARALKDVLGLPRSARLRRVRRQGMPGVRLVLFGDELSLEELSDGYQSVLGLTCDIIAGLHASSKGALDAAEGLVAIDELGSHLHPRWRMRIVESLRHAFRRVQFLVSTHDPLCLRGLENGEAVVLRRTSRGRIFAVPDLPPIKGLRVDQLLTSEYFGLDSTMDPAIEAKFREKYRLLALRKPTPNQQRRLVQLREELQPFDIAGTTRRERRLLEIIDKELAQTEQEPDQGKRLAIKGETDALVADLNRLLAEGRASV